MGGLSIWHSLIVLIIWTAWIVPLYRIFGRIGFAKGWAFLALFPPAGMVMLWVTALARWPKSESWVRRGDDRSRAD